MEYIPCGEEVGEVESGEDLLQARGETSPPIGIVVVDDHESVRASISRIVSLQEDMKLLGEAPDGRSALEVVERTHPDLVLVDIRMPEMDGLELIRILRQSYPQMRIVALSAHEDEFYVSEALKQGADTYVLKGMPLRELVGTIRRVTRGRIDLPSEVTEPLISRFRLADSVLGMLGQAFLVFQKNEEVLDFLARSAAELCGGELYAVAFREGEGFRMEGGKFREESKPSLCGEEAWLLSTRDLSELAALVNARHPSVFNEYRLRDRARGWRSPIINIVLDPVFVHDELEALILVAGSRPFHLSPPLIRYLGLISDQAAILVELEAVRRERSRLQAANRRLKALLRYVAGEVSGGSLQRMMEVLVENLGLRAGALLRWNEGGRWTVSVRCGLSDGEAQALAEGITARTGRGVELGGPVAWTGSFLLPEGGERGGEQGLLVLPVDPLSRAAGGEEGEVLDLEEEGLEGGHFLPPYLMALLLPDGFRWEEEMDVLQGFAACLADQLARLSEEVW